MKKKFLTIIIAIILVLTMVAVVNAAYGSEDDPLITLSYFEQQKTAIMNEVKSLIGNNSGGTGGTTSSDSLAYVPVQMKKGQSVQAKTGAIEVLLRRGTFVSVDPQGDGLVNMTGGSEAKAGDKLVLQNLYMIARADNRAIKAEADDNWIMVRGDYKVVG